MRGVSILSALIISALLLPADRVCAEDGNLYDTFRGKSSVKVFVSDVVNSTKEDKIDTPGLRKALEDAFSARKSLNFDVVKDKKDAEIIVECEVKKYYWAAEDPIDMIMGTGAIAMDMLMVDNYAYMEADFTVIGTKKNRRLWHRFLKIDLTKNKMNEQESLPLINEKAARIFMRDCFSKKRSHRT